MSTLAGSNLSFSINIGAKDRTGGAIRAAARRFVSFARAVSKPIMIPLRIGRKGLALARDINVGLAPIVRGIDHLIERGTGLEVIRKSFESLTGKSGRQAHALARRLVDAASGTIRLAKGMQVANRAMASGLSFEQIAVAMDFVSKKAITTGISASGAIEKVITGLSRGSTLFLDDFGILVDGIEGVKRAYSSIKGAAPWDSLGPAAQKAETIRQAIAEMGGQLGRIGVTGKETIFTFQGIKNEIGNTVDTLFAAVGRSKALKNALEAVRDVVGGMTEHFQRGGGFMELLTGGKSGGLLGILSGGVLDLGELLGRGILGGILKGFSALPELFKSAWVGLKKMWGWAVDQIPPAIVRGLSWLKTDFLPALKGTLTDMLNLPAKLRGAVEERFYPGAGISPWEALKAIFGGRLDPRPDRSEGVSHFVMPASLLGALQAVSVGQVGDRKSIFDRAGEWADKLLGGGILGGRSRLRGRLHLFGEDFPPPKVTRKAVIPEADDSALALSQRGITMRRQRINLLERQIRREEGVVGRQARRQAGELARQKRREGFDVTAEDRQRLEREIRARLSKERTGGLRDRARMLRGELTGDEEMKQGRLRRDINQNVEEWKSAQATEPMAAVKDQITRLVDKVVEAAAEMKEAAEAGKLNTRTLVSWVKVALAELSGAEGRLTRIR